MLQKYTKIPHLSALNSNMSWNSLKNASFFSYCLSSAIYNIITYIPLLATIVNRFFNIVKDNLIHLKLRFGIFIHSSRTFMLIFSYNELIKISV